MKLNQYTRFLGPDIQYVKPARGRFDNALVVGLRVQLRL